jgi:hypothetical protein
MNRTGVELPKSDRPILDLHVHVGPEFLTRRYDMESLAAEAQRDFFGFAAKNHFQPTTAWASKFSTGGRVPIVGSITLNKGVGGINPEAVRAALSGLKSNPLQVERDRGRFIVWMPTIHAEAHLVHNQRRDIISSWGCSVQYQRTYPPGEGLTVLDPANRKRLSPEARAVLEIIASEDLVLATGHLASEEVELVAREALAAGVKRIILTHPFYQATHMAIDKQVELSRNRGVFVELAYVNLEFDGIPIQSYMDLIRAAGAESVILTTDLGQARCEPIASGWNRYFTLLKAHGVSDSEFAVMAIHNPHRLVLEDI